MRRDMDPRCESDRQEEPAEDHDSLPGQDVERGLTSFGGLAAAKTAGSSTDGVGP